MFGKHPFGKLPFGKSDVKKQEDEELDLTLINQKLDAIKIQNEQILALLIEHNDHKEGLI